MPVARNDFIHVRVLNAECLHSDRRQLLTVFYRGLSVHGGHLRYDGIGQIQKGVIFNHNGLSWM